MHLFIELCCVVARRAGLFVFSLHPTLPWLGLTSFWGGIIPPRCAVPRLVLCSTPCSHCSCFQLGNLSDRLKRKHGRCGHFPCSTPGIGSSCVTSCEAPPAGAARSSLFLTFFSNYSKMSLSQWEFNCHLFIVSNF